MVTKKLSDEDLKGLYGSDVEFDMNVSKNKTSSKKVEPTYQTGKL